MVLVWKQRGGIKQITGHILLGFMQKAQRNAIAKFTSKRIADVIRLKINYQTFRLERHENEPLNLPQ